MCEQKTGLIAIDFYFGTVMMGCDMLTRLSLSDHETFMQYILSRRVQTLIPLEP